VVVVFIDSDERLAVEMLERALEVENRSRF
jgi:hypothetical protein